MGSDLQIQLFKVKPPALNATTVISNGVMVEIGWLVGERKKGLDTGRESWSDGQTENKSGKCGKMLMNREQGDGRYRLIVKYRK